ncbi:MAG: hypothetical protein Q8922_12600 [Bacteroidota bacterium]|nr:hypothetical protein [Bacteroidota bacterium]MDP4233040.1 hypothetical protein [Bacteroidota bacterium]MDP4241815.1 hypothetical protein [Bacteroidota bacterium]MDP4288764.1 hypothetical protein [Bacteroidota bacterium]
MRYGRLIAALLLFVLCRGTLLAQVLTSRPHIGVEQVPIGEDVYAFLRHLSVRGTIEGYSETELPLTEYEVSQFLEQARGSTLSSSESELLQKYLRTYAHKPREAVTMFPAREAEPLFWGGIPTDKDKYLYRWFDDSTQSDLFVHAVGSIDIRRKTEPDPASVGLLTVGGRFSGTLTGRVGYYMQTTNGERVGDAALALEDPILGRNNDLRYFSKQFFDFTSAELAYDNDWFTAKLAREQAGIGGGFQSDNILLSPSVPFLDFLSLSAHAEAVRYQAMLASLVDDTITEPAPALPVKYLALHDLTIQTSHNVEFGFTDIMVFAQRLDLGYLNPFSFLGTVKHQLNQQDQDNSLLGAHARWRLAPGIELRGQALLDDLVASKIGTGYWGNKWAWQFGAMWAGAFGMHDLDWEMEWIRVDPYTYTHWDPHTQYSSSQTILGAQIGPNAQSLWSMLRWVPSAKWTAAFEGQFVQRGENVFDTVGTLLYNAGSDYTLGMSKEGQENQTYFLNGRRVNILTLTATLSFEPWRGLVVFARGTKKGVDYLNEAPVTPGIDLGGRSVSLAPRELPETLVAFGVRALF